MKCIIRAGTGGCGATGFGRFFHENKYEKDIDHSTGQTPSRAEDFFCS